MIEKREGRIARLLGWIEHYAIWVFLWMFTGTCTYLFFAAIAPPSAPWLAFLVLVAFELGFVHWLHYHKKLSKGLAQFVVSLLMVIISALGMVTITGVYLWELFISRGLLQAVPWIVSAANGWAIVEILLNVLAFATIPLIDPDHLARIKAIDRGQGSEKETILVVEDEKQTLPLAALPPSPNGSKKH